MSRPAFVLALRLRAAQTAAAAFGMAAVIVLVGSLFPSIGGSIGRLAVPAGVAQLLGGADYGTIAGWMRSEIGAIYGPLVMAVVTIGAATAIAGEEERGILGVVAAHPVTRSRLLAAHAAATACAAVVVALGTLLGLVVGVAIAGGGIGFAELAALALQLALFGCAVGALALALAATTGRKGVAVAGAGGFAVTGFLINGFAPLVGGITWLRYLSPIYYYEQHDPLVDGVGARDAIVLAAAAVALFAVAIVGFRRRDLRT